MAMSSWSQSHFTAEPSLPDESEQGTLGRPRWDGDRQRSQLSGFARLRAILWRRSLWLYQTYCLLGTDWYLPLQRALRQGPKPDQLFSARRVQSAADTFGETPILTTVRLIQTLEGVLGKLPTPFVDLGCGRGVTCLTAACLGHQAVGLEQEQSWVSAAQTAADTLQIPARFEQGDLRQAEWPAGGTFLAVATAFPEDLRQEILGRWLSQLATETVLVTVDWDLGETSLELLWTARLPVDWGTAQFALWRRQDDALKTSDLLEHSLDG